MTKIVVATRCLNGLEYIERFVSGYSFADQIVVSEGGSDDGSIEKWMEYYPKVQVFKFDEFVMRGGYKWNPDNNHIQHAINKGLETVPDWLILDDLDDVPNALLRGYARELLELCEAPQVNVFRLYMWGDDQYFPYMNRDFNINYTSLWAWRPAKVNISTDKSVEHGTLNGLSRFVYQLNIPYCLLHKSWDSETIDAKVNRYNAIGLPMGHPFTFAGEPKELPDWAVE